MGQLAILQSILSSAITDLYLNLSGCTWLKTTASEYIVSVYYHYVVMWPKKLDCFLPYDLSRSSFFSRWGSGRVSCTHPLFY